jgi:hypothetical protein
MLIFRGLKIETFFEIWRQYLFFRFDLFFPYHWHRIISQRTRRELAAEGRHLVWLLESLAHRGASGLSPATAITAQRRENPAAARLALISSHQHDTSRQSTATHAFWPHPNRRRRPLGCLCPCPSHRRLRPSDGSTRSKTGQQQLRVLLPARRRGTSAAAEGQGGSLGRIILCLTWPSLSGARRREWTRTSSLAASAGSGTKSQR